MTATLRLVANPIDLAVSERASAEYHRLAAEIREGRGYSAAVTVSERLARAEVRAEEFAFQLQALHLMGKNLTDQQRIEIERVLREHGVPLVEGA